MYSLIYVKCQWRLSVFISSLREHCLIRMRDGDLLTSKENGYWHYLFDLLLNADLNYCPSALIMSRGVEILVDG